MGARFEDLRRDAVYGLRLLAKNRSFTIIAGLTLALGIGATSAIFSILNASVLGPLPFRDPERLVWIELADEQGRTRGVPVPAVESWRRESRTLDHVSHALMGQVQFTLQFPGGAERVRFEQVDFHTFPLFGVEPILGRWFRPDEVIVQGNTAQTVVISYGMWQRLFGGDPDVIGKSLPGWTAGWGEIVIGVMPRGFYTHPSRLNTDAWYVIANNPGATIGRLAEGVTMEQAQTELNAMAPPAGPQGRGPAGGGAFRVGVGPLHEVYTRGYARTLYLLLGAVGFVLLIATVNVTNLQLNRGLARQTEMATRIALGAGRWRVFRQLVVENVILVLVGGVLGILVAYAGIRLFVYVAPTFYPPSQQIGIDRNVLIFMLGVCLATGILSGLAPGLRAANPDLHTSLKQGARGSAGSLRLRVRRALVVVEIALAMVLLVGAGLMINSYARATSVDMGLDADDVLSMDVSLMGMDRYRTRFGTNHYATTPAGAPFFTQALEGIAALPGVESVGLASVLPPGGGPSVSFHVVGGSTPEGSTVQYYEVSPDFFETTRIRVVRGRVFSETDHAAAPAVAIVNEAFVREFLGGEDPIGQVLQASLTDGNPKLTPDRARQVVGVVGDVRPFFRSDFEPIVYVPYLQHLTDYSGFATFGLHSIKRFVVRTASSDPTTVAAGVRRVFANVDPGVAVENIQPMRAALATSAGGQAFWMRLLGIFAGLGVFLAAIGVYGVVSYSVEQRTQEFGIRATFGAQNSDIQRLVLREGLAVTVIGLIIGVVGAFAATGLLENQLFGVSRLDPVTIAAVAFALLAISLLACYIPGRRTTRLDPLRALRVE